MEFFKEETRPMLAGQDRDISDTAAAARRGGPGDRRDRAIRRRAIRRRAIRRRTPAAGAG